VIKITTNTDFLKQKCKPVEPADKSHVVSRLMLAMRSRTREGFAITANQIGIKKRAFIVNEGGKFKYYINPELIEANGEQYKHTEGCLSIPGKEYTVLRYPEVVVTDDVNGKQTLTGLMAAIWQHEFDHLEGRLISELQVS